MSVSKIRILCVDEARQAVWELRSPSLEKDGDFSKAVMKVSERALQGTNIRLQFTMNGEHCKPAPAVQDNFLRICEEAATNAVRHACPTLVEVELGYVQNKLCLRIRDDGCGFDLNGPNAAKDGHFGLIGIRERAKSIDGNLTLKSSPGHGTEIMVSISRIEA